ncbi:MAG: hypothetical protein HOE30_12225 [Deltaproteobacteria bacterium]|nr:hypothetical protein [Deltaproteobacteria bacterium]MBT4089250.1 hypothetical protein [Deltaproteobacteria bacterium]MBT4269617.1 hypothetical protein [Deltaproteobacteria bacterium]MBT4642791.1 hypothetical protein [Deltaproteobacteria bacterium]MBT6499780.1 hypothetical protein [Deltaproteobacteria bacterium]
MNIVVCAFAVYNVLNLIPKRLMISRWSRSLLYLGIALPSGDYLLRFLIGEIWFQTGGLIFHSVTYQSLFWGVIALLSWVYQRDVKIASKFLLPLAGLLLYALFSVFGTENLPFLSPFSLGSFKLGWVNSGYLIPVVVFTILWFATRWSEVSGKTISTLALSMLVVFITYSGISHFRINREWQKFFPEAQIVSIVPFNHQQTIWRVVTCLQGSYFHSNFHFIQGQRGEIAEQPALSDSEASQLALLDPVIRVMFQKAFKNPVIQTNIQNESMHISISELLPLIEPIWIKQIQLRKNKSGQMVIFEINYGTVL